MAWTSPRSWIAGEVVTAALLNSHLRDNLLAIGAGAANAWTAYTPTVRANANTVTISGNDSRYAQVGKTVKVTGQVNVTSAAASGTIGVSLPVIARAVDANRPFGVGLFFDNSAGTNAVLFVFYDSTTGTTDIRFRSATGVVLASDLAAGDVLTWQVTYEAA